MNRLTRLLIPLNSPESHRFIIPFLRRDPTVRFLAGISLISTQNAPIYTLHIQKSLNSPSPNRKFTASTILAGPRKLDPRTTAIEDLVHIVNPNSKPNVESVYDGIVGDDERRSAQVFANGKGEGSDQRKVLPEELSRNVVVLSCESTAEGGSCDVYLVGTCHVSQESCREVEAVINFLKPQVVFLELCSSRKAALTRRNLKVPTMREMVDMWKKKHDIFGILLSWFYAKVGNELGVCPGSEFRVAFEAAGKYGGKVILGDRPVHVTLQRTWGKMPLWQKAKLFFQPFFLSITKDPDKMDLNKMVKEINDIGMYSPLIQEMNKEFPTLMETLLHERDQYMSFTLLRVASEHSLVVAVVGMGHLEGIKKHWKQPVEVKNLLEIPSKKGPVSAVKIVTSLGVAVAGVAIYLFSKK